FGEIVGDALYVCSAHVNAHFLDAGGIRVVVVDMISEPRNRLGVIAFGDVDDLPGVDVDEQRNVVLAALGRGFVDGDASHVGEIHARHGRLDIVLDDTPQSRVVLSDEAGGSSNRHTLNEG